MCQLQEFKDSIQSLAIGGIQRTNIKTEDYSAGTSTDVSHQEFVKIALLDA